MKVEVKTVRVKVKKCQYLNRVKYLKLNSFLTEIRLMEMFFIYLFIKKKTWSHTCIFVITYMNIFISKCYEG